MKQPYLSAEMDVRLFDSGDIINCSVPPKQDDVNYTEDVDNTSTEQWVPSCNQGKPDYNAWG